MRKNRLLLIITCAFIFFQFPDVFAQLQKPIQIKGRVIAEPSRTPLEYASITVNNTNISTVTNQDGFFSLTIPESAKNYQLKIQHLGYSNITIPIITLIGKDENIIRMRLGSIQLDEVEVLSGDGLNLVKQALRSITDNYEDAPNMMVAFYRESIKKGSKYISLVEAVLDVYKASYNSYRDDQAKIYIGRKATDVSAKDTVFMKFQGGISDALKLDIAKHPAIVFGEEAEGYHFNINGIVTIDNRPHYVIDFFPYEGIPDILFSGKIYLDVKSLAFKRMEFNLNVKGRKDAAAIFIKKKPKSMRAAVESAKYVVDYVEKNDKWYFNYSRTEVKFRVRWKKRSFFGLFSSNYTISSEIAITDRYDNNVRRFPRKERVRSTDIIAEKVENFQNIEFWGDYTVIEPDKEITNAIKHLSDKLLRRK